MASMDELQRKTMGFFLGAVAGELERELDWRAGGHGKGAFRRAGIYAAALSRDLIRIPTHHRDGIAQARFRARIGYITEVAIPTLRFFLNEYPLDGETTRLLGESIEELQQGVALSTDGKLPAIDEWYATMEEFHQLTEQSKRAAERIRRAYSDVVDPSA